MSSHITRSIAAKEVMDLSLQYDRIEKLYEDKQLSHYRYCVEIHSLEVQLRKACRRFSRLPAS
jgi:hypothetical protein